jgi:hypothetical protein
MDGAFEVVAARKKLTGCTGDLVHLSRLFCDFSNRSQNIPNRQTDQ